MRLYAKLLPEYFKMLDFKTVEFRQIEGIALENSETHETRVFGVKTVRMCPVSEAAAVKGVYSKVPWDPNLPLFAFELGDEIKTAPESSRPAETGTRDGKDSKYEFYGQRRKELAY